jgi:subtilisin family serine protease
LAAATAVGLSLASTAGAARNPIARSSGGKFNPSFVPYGVSTKPTTVVVQLAGDPIVVADANAPSPLSKSDKDSLRSKLKAAQAPVAQQIQALGGKVLATYQAAYDGIKVQIATNRLTQLSGVAGVTGVFRLPTFKASNVQSVPYIGAPAVWDGLAGLHGEGIKIADIDTGIDYTHADFGGSGNPADYLAAKASDTLAPNPLWFGPLAPKVKGGIDLVGDAYDADTNPVPVPDPNPLDCNDHGTHTAGTIAGFGVLANGQRYAGAYNASTISSNSWLVGPGVAPKADLYSVKIFGCQGTTDEVIDGIEWAVDNNMDVINLSLGSPFGSPDDPDAVAASNAVKDGVIVVSGSGNEGPNPYMAGTPAVASGVIDVAANDPNQSTPGAKLTLTKADTTSGGTLDAQNSNGLTPLPPGPFTIKVVYSSPGTISLGCSPADDGAPLPPNTFIVVQRGVCARAAKAIYGQQAGAAGVIMVNTDPGYPPYEGQITSNPDTGAPYTVTIPFLGVPGTSSFTDPLVAADGGTLTEVAETLTNPGYGGLASFSSWGPATGDSSLKPNVTAPGVNIASAAMGTGNAALVDSGTSMAAPHTTGLAALVKQAHPDWKQVRYWVAAIENTADPSLVAGFSARGAGTGLIQAAPATKTQVVALGDRDNGTMSFGFNELGRDYSQTQSIRLHNFGDSPASFNVADNLASGSPHSTSFSSSITVPPHGDAMLPVRLSVPAATAGGGIVPGSGDTFHDVSGQITFAPAGGSNNGVTLRVPYSMVPSALSDISVSDPDQRQLSQKGSAQVTIQNRHGVVPGNADWYAWGLKDHRDRGLRSDDLKAAGVQSFPQDHFMAFAISTAHRWSNAAMNEMDVLVDVNNDGTPDYDVVAVDHGLLTAGEADGVDVTAVFDLNTGAVGFRYQTDAPTDSSTMVLPVDFDQLTDGNPATSLGGANQRFSYTVESFGLTDGTGDAFSQSAVFNPFNPAVSTGTFDTIPPGGSVMETVSINSAEFAKSAPLGWMIVSHDNSSDNEANFIRLTNGHEFHKFG